MSHRSGFTVTRDDGGGSADNINYEVVYKSFTPSFQSDTIIPTFGNLHRGGGHGLTGSHFWKIGKISKKKL